MSFVMDCCDLKAFVDTAMSLKYVDIYELPLIINVYIISLLEK